MSKLEELMRSRGGNAAESMGVGVTRNAPAAGVGPALPARLDGVTRARNVSEIPVSKVERDPHQPREEFNEDALARLADSIKTKGQLQPIRVRWDEGRAAYLIVCGERRWRAARMAGVPTVTAVVMDGPADPAELLALQVVENCLREDLRPVEQARAFKTLLDRNGWSIRRLAEELALDHSGVAKQLALLELPAPVQDLVDAGSLNPTTAYELTKVDDPAEAEELGRRAVAERLTGAKVKEAVRERRDPRPKPLALEWTTRRGSAVRVALAPGLGPDAAAAELRDALKQLAAKAGTAATDAA